MTQAAKLAPTAQAPQKPPQKKFESIWKVVFTLVTVLMLIISNKIFLFHTKQEFKNHKKGDLTSIAMISLPFGIVYILIDYALHYLFDDWVEKNYLRESKYTSPEARKRRSYTIVRWGYNIIYYTWASITAYILVKDTTFLPPWLGGNGSIYSLIYSRYLEQATDGMRIFYCIQLGKHLSRYFCHTFIRPEGNYYEYVLHHTLSAFLIFFSYMMDMWIIGIFVLFVHDASDVFLALGRGYNQYKYKNQLLKNVFYASAFISWFVFRVAIFSYCCVYAIWYQCLNNVNLNYISQVEIDVFSLPYHFMAFMLSCLLMMHVYWTYYLVESFIAVSVSSKMANHSYD